MRIALNVSEANEGTDSPWWMIVSPRQILRPSVESIVSCITGPFFSREEAEAQLNVRRYDYGKDAHCMVRFRLLLRTV